MRRRFAALSGALWLALSLLFPGGVLAREIVDMAGRSVRVPDDIRRVYVAHDPPMLFMEALAPDLLIGTTLTHSAAAQRFLPPEVRRLPALGGFARVNLERLVALKPDVVIVWNMRGQPDQILSRATELGLPAVMVDAAPFSHYAASFRFLGRLLHREQRAEELARALERDAGRLSAELAQIPQAERARVYYADSADGLQSQCAGFFRGEIVELSGARNVLTCDMPDAMAARVSVSLEKLLLLDPDAIISRTRATARFIAGDPGWQALRAVREHKIFAAPELPFLWVERPHSHFKSLAARLFAHALYPQRIAFAFDADTRAFFKTFYRMDLRDDDLARLRD